MRTIARTYAIAALIAVSTFTMAVAKPEVANPTKAVVNLSWISCHIYFKKGDNINMILSLK